MKTTYQHAFLLFLIIFVVIFSLFNTGAVFAKDDTPPVEPVATEVAVVTDVPSVMEEVSSETDDQIISQPAIVSEVFEQLPEDTHVIVLNENGDVLPLATQGAAEILAESDPMWCPAGQSPGGAGCTASYRTVSQLIANLGSKSGAGTIYFTSNYSINDAIFDHANANLDSLTALTIQGGWNGLIGGSYSLSGNTTFNEVQLRITSWTSTVTINNIVVDGVTGNGMILVETTDDIILNDIQSNNGFEGANLQSQGGSITVNGTNSFNNNTFWGLVIQSNGGDVSLNNITANGNGYIGTMIYTDGGSFTLTGVNTFNNNESQGLTVIANDVITLYNVTANGNYNDGTVLVGSNVTITCGTFQNNSFGIFVHPPGELTLNGVTVSGNTYGDVHAGTVVENSFDCSTPIITPTPPIITPTPPISTPTPPVSTSTPPASTFAEGTTNPSSLSLQLISVNSGDSADFDCKLFAGTALILPNGDKVTFKCPITGSATLDSIRNDSLPTALPKGVEYISGMQATQSPDGSDKALDGQVIVSFINPDNMKGAGLTILYWDGSQWVDLKSASFEDGRVVIDSGYVTGDGYFEAVTNFSGNFVLVTK